KNLSKKGDVPTLKNSLVKFIKLNSNYYQGFELLGLLYEKEENHEAAIEHYEKSVKLKQNKEILSRIKKLKAITEKSTGGREPATTTNPFINISQKVFISPGRIIARDKEIKEMIEILNSDSRNNLILVGDSGVGKTALIKLLAQKIIDNEVPETMKGKNLMEINFVSLITGTKFRGQFEEKVVKLLNEFKVQKNILVLEDIHLMMSQGAARGTSMDLVNILKQFMRDREIQVIATSSYEEFKSVIERDNSLMAFFQRMFIRQLSGTNTTDILKHERDKISESDNIIVSDNIIEQIVENSRGNIMGKKYPDAALLIFERVISNSRLKLDNSNGEAYTVNTEDLSEVLSDILNLPDPDLSFTLKERLTTLERRINEKIIGQEEAVKKLTSGIIVSKLGYDIKDERPDGVFLFVGPTGVGKSETAIVLSKYLYGSGENLVRIDMSEYMERFTYSRFVGAAPGYVGYNDSTQLTDKIRQNPYSVILLDEIEKADYQLLNIFLQVFDAGRLTDARGNVIDFSHSTIIMTSNIGTDLFSKTRLGYQPGEKEGVT
ncbi:MAG: ATP-dependent Clp protease ATP-binding subunit, partial [Candidatus Aminicenantes bacterium]|nr:ATP-dependent Clp protease ATP-binding subunit [Candidatus Aminicenantes bacterium]